MSATVTLDDIQRLLVEASRISNHRAFVIVGSLSAVGAVIQPPPDMVLSVDIDLYPKLDPERGFVEIAEQLGEHSAFAKTHGFYADPVSPRILSLPDGWESRLIQIPFTSGVVAYFLDPTDAAVSKLARSHDNDLRWVRAGIRERIIHAADLASRIGETPILTAVEARRCRDSLAILLQEGGVNG